MLLAPSVEAPAVVCPALLDAVRPPWRSSEPLRGVGGSAVQEIGRRYGGLAGGGQRGCDAGLWNHHAMTVLKIAAAAGASQSRAAGSDATSDGRRGIGGAAVAAVACQAEVWIGPLGLEVGIEILLRCERIRHVGLRAAAAGDGANLRTGVIFVVQALVGRLGVQIDSAAAGGSRWRGLIREIERAAGQISDDAGVAVHREIAAEVQREGADGAAAAEAAEGRRARIVGQDYVGKLLGGDAGARDFDFVFAGRGVEEIIAQAVGGGGIG